MAAGPRRSGIQIALIVVGISLLSVFAVFALVFAFVTYGTEVRMAIILGGTLLTMIAAGALKRRGLDSTGEGIAVLGTVMLVLTAWALRVDSPIGLDSVDDALYWGSALLIIGALCGLWALTNRLSTPSVVAAALVPLGAGLLTWHVVDELLPHLGGAATTAGAVAALATAAFSWLIVRASHPKTRRAARFVAQSVGAIAATIALVSLVELDEGNRWAPLIGGLALAAFAGLHIVTSASAITQARRAIDTVSLAAIGGGVVVAAMAGAVFSALRFDQDRVMVSAPLLAAVLLAIVAEQGWRRSPVGSVWRTALSSATFVAAAHAAIAAGLAALVGASPFFEAATRSLRAVALRVGETVTSAEPVVTAALGALALSLGLIAMSWATMKVLVQRARAVTLVGSILLVAIVPLLGPWWLVMLLFGALAVAAAAGLHRVDRVDSRDARRALLALCIPLATGGALGAFLTGWAVTRGGIVGLIIALLVIGIARTATSLVAVRAAAIAVAALLVLGSAPDLVADAAALGMPELSTAATLALTGAVIIVLTQLGGLSALERRVGSGVALAVALVATVVIAIDASPGTPAVDRVDEVIAVLALVLALVFVSIRRSGLERSVARATVPVVAVAAAFAVTSPFGLDAALDAVVAVSALVVVAALGLVPGRPTGDRPSGFDRTLGDAIAGVLGMIVVAVGLTASSEPSLSWAAVLTLAVLALVTSISRDGLIGSQSPRRFIGWVALGLATVALWMWLVERGTEEPEAYALPLAGAVLLIAAANALVARRSGNADRTAAPLVAGALLVALVPTTLASVDATAARFIVVAAAAVLVSLAPLVAARTNRSTSIETRLPGMTSALVSTGFAALGLLTLVHTVDLVTEFDTASGIDLVRAAVIVALPAAAAVAAWMLTSGRLRAATTAAGSGVAALSAGLLGLTEVVDPVELVSVPLALALLAIGSVRMSENPASRSWPWLAPGVAALLVPSLLAIDDVGEPLWRAIAIGGAALTVFVFALRLKLQAPFVIGGVVLLVHLLVQTWPLLELVGDAVEWWLWLGLAGIIVVALAARYERRLQNVRDVAVRIAQLR